jgi:hypothetical protein
MDNFSRRYYERELGAGIAPSPSMKEHYGYTEPFRRFVQRENFSPQANPLENEMPGWLPGADYLTNFHVGDPYTKVDEGYARLPGAGYEALHPELKGIDPRDYPDINKLAILADVAPYSREYNIFRSKVGRDSQDNTELKIEYEKILDHVRQTRESVIRMEDQVFPSCQPKNASRGRGKSWTCSWSRIRSAGFDFDSRGLLHRDLLLPTLDRVALATAPWRFRCLSSVQNLRSCQPRVRNRLRVSGSQGKPLSPTPHWNLQHTSGVYKGQELYSNNTFNRLICISI